MFYKFLCEAKDVLGEVRCVNITPFWAGGVLVVLGGINSLDLSRSHRERCPNWYEELALSFLSRSRNARWANAVFDIILLLCA